MTDVIQRDDLFECVEVCPHCEEESIVQWNPEKMGYVVHCTNCGKEIMLCDECLHADGEWTGRCDWHKTPTGGKCWRGETHE